MKLKLLAAALVLVGVSAMAITPYLPLFGPSSAPASFSPTNMLLWLKADAIVGYTNTQPLTNWIDSSGFGMDAFQDTHASRPTYETSIANGRPAVFFNSTNSQYFSLPSGIFTNGPENAAEVFIVVKQTALCGSCGGSWLFGNNDPVAGSYDSDGFSDSFCTTLRVTVPAFAPSLASMFKIYNTSSTNGTWIARLNGFQVATRASNTYTNGIATFPTGRKIGSSNNDDTLVLNGWIAEVILYGRVLAEEERVNVQNYLTAKWLPTWEQRVALNGGAAPAAGTVAALNTFSNGLAATGLLTNIVAVSGLVPDSLVATTTPFLAGLGFDMWTNNGFLLADLTVDGLIGDETGKYLQTGVIAGAMWTGMSATSGGLHVMVSDGTNQPAVSACEIGAIQTTSLFDLQRGATTAMFGDCWGSTGADRIQGTLAHGAQGAFFSLNRTAGNAMTNYWASQSQPHAVFATTGTAQTGTTLPTTVAMHVFAFGTTTTPTFFSGHRLSFVAMTKRGLTQVQASNLWWLASNLRTNLGGGNPQ